MLNQPLANTNTTLLNQPLANTNTKIASKAHLHLQLFAFTFGTNVLDLRTHSIRIIICKHKTIIDYYAPWNSG